MIDRRKLIKSMAAVPFAVLPVTALADYNPDNLAAIMWRRLRRRGVKILPLDTRFGKVGSRIGAKSIGGAPYQQRHVDMHEADVVGPAGRDNLRKCIDALADNIAETHSVVRFGPLWLPQPQPDYLTSGRFTFRDVDLRLINTVVHYPSLEPDFRIISRLDALFCNG